jgi:hypothetical protein
MPGNMFVLNSTPDLPQSDDPIRNTIRVVEESKRFKVKPVSVLDLTDPANKKPEVDESLIEISEYFDDFNVMELSYVARHDTINTISSQYAAIKVLPSVNKKYSPDKIIALQGATSYINTFDYDINAYIPNFASGINGEYVNLVDGNMVIDLLRINEERLEVDFLAFDNVFDDTIYV